MTAPQHDPTLDDPEALVSFVERRVLDQHRVGQTRYFHRSVLRHPKAEVIVQHEANKMMLAMEGFVLADRVAKDHYSDWACIGFPTSPWQFFKQRHADSWWLGWLVRRRPVQENHTRLTVDVAVERFLRYPEAALPEQPFGRPVMFDQVTMEKRLT